MGTGQLPLAGREARSLIGILLGLGAGFCFAAGSIFIRIGQRNRTRDDGLLMTVMVNVLVLGLVGAMVERPPWNGKGVAALALAGVVGTVGGRFSNLRAIRLVGPSRANAFLTGVPVVAAAVGWMILGERVAPLEAVGGGMVLAGLFTLTRNGGASTQVDRAGYLFAAAAPTFFGTAFVIRKWGLGYFPSSVLGAFFGAAAALMVIIAGDVASGRFRQRIADNFRRVPWWFAVGGLATTVALLAQFTAFSYLPAWVVGILQGTQGLWTALLSRTFLRGDEPIDRRLAASIVLATIGITLIGLQQ